MFSTSQSVLKVMLPGHSTIRVARFVVSRSNYRFNGCLEFGREGDECEECDASYLRYRAEAAV